jgi:predicted ATPase
MRGRARAAEDIGAGGESLAGFLAGLTTDEQYRLTKALEDFYPWVSWLDIKRLKWGWKSLTVHEAYEVGSVDIDAAHASDGFLRVLAILAQAQGDQSVLLFDEIENGINPELAEKLVDYLRGLDKQVIVTTHSPMILNYIPDEVAKEAVVLLYRTDDGQTKAARYFDAKLPSRKLGPMGPGEVFVDTPIEDVARYFAEGGGESDAPDSKEAWEE